MQQTRKKTITVAEKWGFGMAPPKPHTHQSRIASCETFLITLGSIDIPIIDDTILESLSVLKGMFNRVHREDQWDWFTVSGQLGYPSRRLSRVIADEIDSLRAAIKCGDISGFRDARVNLLRLPTRRCLSVFLGKARVVDEPNAGWIYILSTRDIPDLLKIGMTTRSVEERVREINNATGIAIPFGVRRCWRVITPDRAEKLVHDALRDYRLRRDREFFRVLFVTASKEIESVIYNHHMEIRTLDALEDLGEEGCR